MPSLRGHRLSAVKNDTSLRPMCGPTAIAAIVGKPLSRVRAAMPRFRADGGMSRTEVADTMRALGCRGSWHVLPHRPTLGSWFRARSPEQEAFPCIMFFDRHFAAASGDTYCDTLTGRRPLHADDVPEAEREREVRAVFVVSSRGRMPPTPRTSPKAMRPNPAADFKRALAAAGASYKIDHDPHSYANHLTIRLADGRPLFLRHAPGGWSDDLATFAAFQSDPHSPVFHHTPEAVFAQG